MKTTRVSQILQVRDVLRKTSNCAGKSFSELKEVVKNKKPKDVSLERYTAMTLCFIKGNIIWDDCR